MNKNLPGAPGKLKPGASQRERLAFSQNFTQFCLKAYAGETGGATLNLFSVFHYLAPPQVCIHASVCVNTCACYVACARVCYMVCACGVCACDQRVNTRCHSSMAVTRISLMLLFLPLVMELQVSHSCAWLAFIFPLPLFPPLLPSLPSLFHVLFLAFGDGLFV